MKLPDVVIACIERLSVSGSIEAIEAALVKHVCPEGLFLVVD